MANFDIRSQKGNSMTKKFSQDVFEQAKGFIDQGDIESLKQVIKKHPALCTARNDDKIPPTFDNAVLLYATSWPGGRPNGAAIAKLLIDSGADPMLRFKGAGETVLHWSASIKTDIEIVEALIDCGADVDAQGGVICGGTPLMNALYFGFIKTGALLLSKGAFTSNIIIAAGLGRIDPLESWHQGSGQYLKDSTRTSPHSPSDKDALLDKRSAQTWTYRAVICALVCEQYHVVDWFIEHGFDIDLIPDDVGWSCLHHAAYWGSLPMAMYLVSKGADLHVKEEHQATPADYGGAHGHPEVMNYLIDMGTSTSLEAAASKGRLDKVMQGYAQCEDRARLLMRTIGNTTDIGKPVHESIKKGRVAVAKYLLQKEPDLLHQRVDGKSVISWAEENDDQYWLSFIREQ
jgi:ankyrin repeat protein